MTCGTSFARSRANFSATASVIQVLRDTTPIRCARQASMASKVSAGRRRLMRSRDPTVVAFESEVMAPLWRLPGSASSNVSILFSLARMSTPLSQGAVTMRWRPHAYPGATGQTLDVTRLATLSDVDADEADESGYLDGNQMYQDLRGYGWDDVAAAVAIERRFIARLQAADDLDDEAQRIDDERLECFEPSDGLWELDIGVAAATIALSALGATPVGSCNAGGFGGHHQARYPYVAFYVEPGPAALILALAQAAEVGLRGDDSGLAQIYGAGDLDLLRFAEAALNSQAPTAPSPGSGPSK